MRTLSREYRQRIIQLHPDDGQEWLDHLPRRINAIQELWQIRVSDPVVPLNYHYVAPARRSDGTHVILKLGIPGETIDREAHCLRHFDGRAAAQLLQHSSAWGAILLERVCPGTDLKPLQEEAAISAACSVMVRLHASHPPTSGFPTVADWWKGFERLRTAFSGATGPLPRYLVDEAQALYQDLATSMEAPVLLHGDLHHGNILAGTREPWMAIDPQGVIGEAVYEVGAFIRNPLPDVLNRSDLRQVLARRVAIFSDTLQADRQRVAGWAFAQAVLSAIWSLEDHGSGWEAAIALAQFLRDARSA